MTQSTNGSPRTAIGRIIDWLAAADSAFGHLTTAMNLIGTLWIIIVSVLVVADVFSLNLLNYGLPAVKEFIQLSIPGIVFLQLTNTLREDRHVSSDIFMTPMRRKWPRATGLVYAGFNLVGAMLMFVIGWVMIPKAEQAYDEGFFRGLEGIITLPEWPSMALVVLGSFAMALQYVLFFLRDVAITVRGGPVETKGDSKGSFVE